MAWAHIWSRGEGEQAAARRTLLEGLSRLPGMSDEAVQGIAAVPREVFVPAAQRELAYEDVALQIADNATISAPSMVAEMLVALRLQPGTSVLEIGSGSGYAAATMAALGACVTGLEVNTTLAEISRRNLAEAGIGPEQVRIVATDGAAGWPERAPYDRILVSAAVEALPQAWLEQLAPDGLIVFPEAGAGEDLLVRLSHETGGYRRELLGRCRFVRMKV